MRIKRLSAIDLFCGVGGLSHGLREAGIRVAAGFDIDPKCRYPYETNIGAQFVEQDVRTVTKTQLMRLWEPRSIRLLAGCAPCQPFSSYRRGLDTSTEEQWPLLGEFGRLVQEARPHVVTMENVPRLVSAGIFKDFVRTLEDCGYEVSYKSCYGPEYGLPQHRRRLVLLGSRIGRIEVPSGTYRAGGFTTVRDAISGLEPIESGEVDADDPLHRSRRLTDINLKRIRASRPGGTWHDWPSDLRSECHRRASGATFKNVYARMSWDEPSPTITTMAYNFGTGRFGHPSQDRAISLREAAILQGFPASYRFVEPGGKVEFNPLGRLIGNAVPPVIAKGVGEAVMTHLGASADR
ncbi:DNA cytosine methyltransferase [Micromonospora sp. WMMD882]|uniref:DNA cytosine methyltransferase n=1 Tax=Micromonospora sp. WMMD882 TaxID=3015151 RepID=UPI00248BCDAB|nr:DNA cytosine methyltransferase [Micromonospora sp. WMMD882]WBB82410.1 DNA cytosine methyltransferase [Micromonospora sp. WMMD882]